MDELDAVLSQFNLENEGGDDGVDEGEEPDSGLKLEEMLQNLGLISEESDNQFLTNFQKAMEDEEKSSFCKEEPSVQQNGPQETRLPNSRLKEELHIDEPKAEEQKPQSTPIPKLQAKESNENINASSSQLSKSRPVSPRVRPPPPSREPPSTLQPSDDQSVVHYTNGDWYVGGVEKETNKRHGNGIYCANSGTRYEGGFESGKMHGEGKLMLPNGDLYEGQFVDGVFHGKGTYQRLDGTTIIGDFVSGALRGPAQVKLFNGDEYEGGMEGNTYHGNGQYTYVSGDVFKGSFDESLPTGPAQYTTSQGEVIDGVWQDGLLQAR